MEPNTYFLSEEMRASDSLSPPAEVEPGNLRSDGKRAKLYTTEDVR
jgi:hypothetical protein